MEFVNLILAFSYYSIEALNMKCGIYKIIFYTGKESVQYALCPDQAETLAKAEQIKFGNDYKIKFIYLEEKGNWRLITDYQLNQILENL